MVLDQRASRFVHAAFETTAAYSRMSVSFGEGPDAVRIRASLVSPSFFRVFGVTPTVGRLFTPADGSPSVDVPVAVLGHAFWQLHFARDRGVVGRSVRIGTLTYTVVGVTPSGFKGVESQEPEVWLPMTVDAARVVTFPLSLTDRGSTWLSIVIRRREIAVRLALGARRERLVRQMLAEGLLLAGLGAAAAIYLALLGGRLLGRLMLADTTEGGFVDIRLFAFTAVVALGTGVLISLAPLMQSASPNLSDALRAGLAAGGGRTSRARAALLVVQAALCMLLLVGAGLFAQSLRRVEGLDLAEWDPYTSSRAVAPHTPTRSEQQLWGSWFPEATMESAVGIGFFRTVGATLKGRDFEATDRRGAPRVAIVNEPLARLLWPGEDPLGRCMLLSSKGGECVTVVGVLGGFWYRSILERELWHVYVPMAQSTFGLGRPEYMFIAVRSDRVAVMGAVRHALQSVRPDMPAVSVTRMRDVVDPEIRPWRLAATLFSMFAGVALLRRGGRALRSGRLRRRAALHRDRGAHGVRRPAPTHPRRRRRERPPRRARRARDRHRRGSCSPSLGRSAPVPDVAERSGGDSGCGWVVVGGRGRGESHPDHARTAAEPGGGAAGGIGGGGILWGTLTGRDHFQAPRPGG